MSSSKPAIIPAKTQYKAMGVASRAAEVVYKPVLYCFTILNIGLSLISSLLRPKN